MYKASIRALLRHSIDKLNHGDYSLMLKMASPDFALAFPGDNSWSTMFRPQQRGRAAHVTHRGIEEAGAFADRFVAEGIQIEIEDILVNGPPWNTRIAVPRPRLRSRRRRRRCVQQPGGALPRAQMGTIGPVGGLRRHRARGDVGPRDGGHQDVRLTTTPGPDAEDSRHPMQSVRRSATYLSRSDDIIKGVPMRRARALLAGARRSWRRSPSGAPGRRRPSAATGPSPRSCPAPRRCPDRVIRTAEEAPPS